MNHRVRGSLQNHKIWGAGCPKPEDAPAALFCLVHRKPFEPFPFNKYLLVIYSRPDPENTRVYKTDEAAALWTGILKERHGKRGKEGVA